MLFLAVRYLIREWCCACHTAQCSVGIASGHRPCFSQGPEHAEQSWGGLVTEYIAFTFTHNGLPDWSTSQNEQSAADPSFHLCEAVCQ